MRQVQAEESRGFPTCMSRMWVKMCLPGQYMREKEEFVRRKVFQRKVRGVYSRQREWHAGECKEEKEHSLTSRAVPSI